MAPAPVIRLHPDDGVLIARSSLPAGMVVAEGVTTVERIPAGHKVAIRPIATGEAIRRYGQIIGFATAPIAPGQHVHTQNCGMGDGRALFHGELGGERELAVEGADDQEAHVLSSLSLVTSGVWRIANGE